MRLWSCTCREFRHVYNTAYTIYIRVYSAQQHLILTIDNNNQLPGPAARKISLAVTGAILRSARPFTPLHHDTKHFTLIIHAHCSQCRFLQLGMETNDNSSRSDFF